MRVIDSHTGGEPTRIVVEGGPNLGGGPLKRRVEIFREKFDHIRSAVVNEPRGNDAMVGALLCSPHDSSCAAGVIFFNNVGYLGMCGHGTIGLTVTLAYLKSIGTGVHRFETPVGVVQATLHESGEVTVANVASYRKEAGVVIQVEGFGAVEGDIAWGGNWFFLTAACPIPIIPANIEALTGYTSRIRKALERDGMAYIDHIEVFSETDTPGADSRNFVLCPGKAYDRSPCGTGTSAKLACLFAAGKLKAGRIWRQESVTGSIFEGSITLGSDGAIFPHIKGSAFVNADATLIFDEKDPFVHGIRTS